MTASPYRQNPAWIAAQAIYIDPPGANEEQQYHQRLTAAGQMYAIEAGLVDCEICRNTGRAVIDGIDRHCACILGRAMSRTHWADKAAEEARA